MNRKDFLKHSFAGLALGTGLSDCKPSRNYSNIENLEKLPYLVWRIASSFPRGIDTIYNAAEVFAEKVKLLSGGRFKIRVFPAGELVPGLQVLDAVQNGTIQMGHSASYYFTGKNPALAFDCGVPFGLTSRQQNAWQEFGGGKELLASIFSDFNILSLPGGNTGTQMGGWFRNEVKNLSELKGIKMRIPGLGGQVMNRLEVNVQVLAGGDIYPALERGAIDATEWVGPHDDEKLGFYKVAKYYYYPGFWEPSAQISFYINTEEWKTLPEIYKEIIKLSATEANIQMMANYDYLNPIALESLLRKGVQLREFSKDILIEARKKAFEIMEENAAKDAAYKKIYLSWKNFREASFKWFNKSETSYANFAYGESK